MFLKKKCFYRCALILRTFAPARLPIPPIAALCRLILASCSDYIVVFLMLGLIIIPMPSLLLPTLNAPLLIISLPVSAHHNPSHACLVNLSLPLLLLHPSHLPCQSFSSRSQDARDKRGRMTRSL